MKFRVAVAGIVGVAASLAAGAITMSAQATAPGKTVWAGVYTEAQAKRGEKLYAERCVACHAADLRGAEIAPGLVGEEFAAKWEDVTLDSLFEIMRVTMPQDQPGSMTRQEMADVLAFVLHRGGFPAGKTELPGRTDTLSEIAYRATKP
jgi:mono/diheme cytochrome c family protein